MPPDQQDENIDQHNGENDEKRDVLAAAFERDGDLERGDSGKKDGDQSDRDGPFLHELGGAHQAMLAKHLLIEAARVLAFGVGERDARLLPHAIQFQQCALDAGLAEIDVARIRGFELRRLARCIDDPEEPAIDQRDARDADRLVLAAAQEGDLKRIAHLQFRDGLLAFAIGDVEVHEPIGEDAQHEIEQEEPRAGPVEGIHLEAPNLFASSSIRLASLRIEK